MPKLLATKTSALPLIRSNVLVKALLAIVSTEKCRKIINNPNRI